MAISLRLSRGGSKRRPYYRIVVADARSPRDGKFIERIGTYNPLLAKDSPERVKLDTDRAEHWLSVGAQPTDRVARFLDAAGVRERTVRNNPHKGKPGEKAIERAEKRAERLRAAAEAGLEAVAVPHGANTADEAIAMSDPDQAYSPDDLLAPALPQYSIGVFLDTENNEEFKRLSLSAENFMTYLGYTSELEIVSV